MTNDRTTAEDQQKVCDVKRGSTLHSPRARSDAFSLPPIEPHPIWRPSPDVAECKRLWECFGMPDHIREHSRLVAVVAESLALSAVKAGLPVDTEEVRAAALLHDLAKDYTIRHGGNHAQLGGAWVMQLTGNPRLAQGVVHHVYWPWDIDVRTAFLPLTVIYADKRVKHDRIVSLETRYEDLFTRYGKTEHLRGRIEVSRQQALAIQQALSETLQEDVHARTFDSGRLV